MRDLKKKWKKDIGIVSYKRMRTNPGYTLFHHKGKEEA
jgi:hypothetical protein